MDIMIEQPHFLFLKIISLFFEEVNPIDVQTFFSEKFNDFFFIAKKSKTQ